MIYVEQTENKTKPMLVVLEVLYSRGETSSSSDSRRASGE